MREEWVDGNKTERESIEKIRRNDIGGGGNDFSNRGFCAPRIRIYSG